MRHLLAAIALLWLPVAALAEVEHGDVHCYGEHGGVAGQMINTSALQPLQQPVWSQTSAIINISAVSHPKVSPVAMMFLDGKIVPAVMVKPLKADSSAGSDQKN